MDLVEVSRPPSRSEQHRLRRLIPCAPPFDLGASLAFLGGFGPMRGEQEIAAGALTKALKFHGGRVVAFWVCQEGRPSAPRTRLPAALGPFPHAHRTTGEDDGPKRIGFSSARTRISRFALPASPKRSVRSLRRGAALRGLHHVTKFPTCRSRCACCRRDQPAHPATAWPGDDDDALPPAGGQHREPGALRCSRCPEAATVAALPAGGGSGPGWRERARGEGDRRHWQRRFSWTWTTRFLARGAAGRGGGVASAHPGWAPSRARSCFFRGLGRLRASRWRAAPSSRPRRGPTGGRSPRPKHAGALSGSYGSWKGGHWALYLWASTFAGLAAG